MGFGELIDKAIKGLTCLFKIMSRDLLYHLYCQISWLLMDYHMAHDDEKQASVLSHNVKTWWIASKRLSKANRDGSHVEYAKYISTMMKSLFVQIKGEMIEACGSMLTLEDQVTCLEELIFDQVNIARLHTFSTIQDKSISHMWWSFYWKLAIQE